MIRPMVALSQHASPAQGSESCWFSGCVGCAKLGPFGSTESEFDPCDCILKVLQFGV